MCQYLNTQLHDTELLVRMKLTLILSLTTTVLMNKHKLRHGTNVFTNVILISISIFVKTKPCKNRILGKFLMTSYLLLNKLKLPECASV